MISLKNLKSKDIILANPFSPNKPLLYQVISNKDGVVTIDQLNEEHYDILYLYHNTDSKHLITEGKIIQSTYWEDLYDTLIHFES